jgi:hypothetical protein
VEPELTPEELELIKRRLASNQPRFTSQQVAAHFRALEEAINRDGLNKTEALALLKRLQAADGKPT